MQCGYLHERHGHGWQAQNLKSCEACSICLDWQTFVRCPQKSATMQLVFTEGFRSSVFAFDKAAHSCFRRWCFLLKKCVYIYIYTLQAKFRCTASISTKKFELARVVPSTLQNYSVFIAATRTVRILTQLFHCIRKRLRRNHPHIRALHLHGAC